MYADANYFVFKSRVASFYPRFVFVDVLWAVVVLAREGRDERE